jgi:hypothetical protein
MPLPNPPPCARCGHAHRGQTCYAAEWTRHGFRFCPCRRYTRTKPKAKEARRG